MGTCVNINQYLETPIPVMPFKAVNEGLESAPRTPSCPPSPSNSLIIDESSPKPNTPPKRSESPATKLGSSSSTGQVLNNRYIISKPYYFSKEKIHDDTDDLHRSQTADPQAILHDLQKIKESINKDTWNILWKMHSKIQSHAFQVEELNDHVGTHLTSADYFLNGQSEPQNYDDNQTMSENLLGLKNTLKLNKKALDNHISKTIQDSKLVNEKLENLQLSKAPTALPKAEFEKLKKNIAAELAKNQSMTSGNAFTNMDLQNRIVKLEQSNVKGWSKLEAVGKAVSIIKNRTEPDAENLPENKSYELDRIR